MTRQHRPASNAPSHHAPALPLPHDQDESHGRTAAQPHEVMRQAKRDIDAGQVDTDMRATPGLDAARREAMVPTPTADVGSRRRAAAPMADTPPARRRPR